MSVRGKSTWAYVVTTYCDYGELNRQTRICRHYSYEAAERAWNRMKRWYGHNVRHSANYNIWQVDRASGKIIREMETYGHKKYGPVPA